MSPDVVIASTAVSAWALYLLRYVVLKRAHLALEERAAIRRDAMFERDAGVVAQLRARVEEAEKVVSSMRSEQKTFMANARSK